MDLFDIQNDARRTLTNQSWTSLKDIFEVKEDSPTFKHKDRYPYMS